jgi:hypothetical protein
MGELLEMMDNDQLDEELIGARKKLNKEQLAFARCILRGESQVDAYKLAGYKFKKAAAGYTGASRLLKLAKIQRYMAVETEMTARVEGITKDWLLRKQIQLAKKAEAAGEFAAARACLAEVTKLLDYYPALKQQVEHNHKGAISLSNLTSSQWESLLDDHAAPGANVTAH